MNKVLLCGRLTADPELRFSQGSNMAVARFTVAVDKGYSRDKREEFKKEGRPTADFPRVVVFGKQADNCGLYLAKGMMCAVEGSVQTGSYTNKEGRKIYTTEVLAQRVEFIERKPKNEMNQTRPDDQQIENENQDKGNDFDSFSQINDEEFPW